jgi:aldehyde dehydrogenase (NAD+)
MNSNNIQSVVSRLRSTFDSGKTRPISWRLEQLHAMRDMIREREQEIFDALAKDLGKSRFESWVAEAGFSVNEVDYAIKRLKSWMKPRRVKTPMSCLPGGSFIQWEPLGVALIISPWNYPILLTMGPLVGAIAAGNCVVIKPSEISANTSGVIARCLRDFLDNDAVAVVEGRVKEATELLKERFDHILFTGGTEVGRIVMEAAARHLTPVTLELGGKCPCIIDKSVNLKVAARRIAWGKFVNAGQTCIAPDYVLVREEMEEDFIEKLKAETLNFYGDDPKRSPDYARIINDLHFRRLTELLGSGRIAFGGEADTEARYIAPTVLRDVPQDSPVMAEEIFGPILPVLKYADIDEAIAFVNARPKPLALYLFSTDKAVQKKVLSSTSSGGVCLNDLLMQLFVPELPFGGVGLSGMGSYKGRQSFETFSHRKSVLKRSLRFDVPLRYPPFSESKLKWLKRVM